MTGQKLIKYRSQLPSLLKDLGLPMVAVEIGVAEGYNSIDLLNNGILKLYMVDNWGTINGQRGDGGQTDSIFFQCCSH